MDAKHVNRQSVGASLDNAITRPEIERAQALLQRYVMQFPDDADRDMGHGFVQRIHHLEEREAQACQLGLTPQQCQEREALVKNVMALARGDMESRDYLLHLSKAEKSVQEWAEQFPNDPLTVELLSLLQSRQEDTRLTVEALRQMSESPLLLQPR